MKILYCSSKLIFYLKNNSMHQFEDIPVCLDLREKDDSLVRYRKNLVRCARENNITFTLMGKRLLTNGRVASCERKHLHGWPYRN